MAAMRYELVIFDMDGTLIAEMLDFDAIRAEIALAECQPILETIAALPAEERSRAQTILERHEDAAASSSTLHDGALEVIATLRRAGVKTALLTRNSRRCAAVVLKRHGLQLDHLATREDPPYKPHADSILNIVRKMGARREQTLMVGDYLYDLQAAANAGVDSVLLCLAGEARPDFSDQATYMADHLHDVLAIMDGKHPRQRKQT